MVFQMRNPGSGHRGGFGSWVQRSK